MSGKTWIEGPKVDRRVARTRRTLHQALLRLIVTKGYAAITVQDLLDEADVGRSTFYAHFAGKDDLLRRGFDHLRADLASSNGGQPGSGPLGFSAAMFAHAERYRETYRALVGSRANGIVLEEIRGILLAFVEPELGGMKRPTPPLDLLARYIVDSFQSVLTWWLERRPELPAAEVDRLFRQLVVPTLPVSSGASEGD